MDHRTGATGTHPLLACAAQMGAALKDVAGVEPMFMSAEEKRDALLELSRVAGQLAELRLRVLAAAEDVGEESAARDAAAWLAHAARLDRGQARRDAKLAAALDRRWTRVAAALRDGIVNLEQAHEIVRALDALPDDIAPEIRGQAEERLIEKATEFGPRGCGSWVVGSSTSSLRRSPRSTSASDWRRKRQTRRRRPSSPAAAVATAPPM